MVNQINPNASLNIGNNNYAFTSVPKFPEIPYAEVGRRAKVYRLKSGKDFYALKVFKYAFRKQENVANCAVINEYRKVPGLKAAERTVLYPEDYPELVAQYPDFEYAVLMPWMTGESWYNIISNKTDITADQSLKLAKALAGLMAGLEKRQMAHCDLSSSNFVFSEDFEHVELVDLEEMFGLSLKTPDPLPAGTSGYAPEWVMRKGCWSAGADRFSAGILISEILGWRDERIRQKAYGETYFNGPIEFKRKNERHALIGQVLGEIHPKLVELFNQAWFAGGIEECPRIEEWQKALEDIPVLEAEPAGIDFGTIKKGKQVSAALTVINAGGGTLAGEIIPQEEWVRVNPGQFKCAEGKTSQHLVTFDVKNLLSSKYLEKQEYSRDDFLIAESNGNARKKTISAKIALKRKSSILYLFLIMLLAILGIYLLAKPSPPSPQPTSIPANSVKTDVPNKTSMPIITSTSLPGQVSIPGWKKFIGGDIELWLPKSFIGGNFVEDSDFIMESLNNLGTEYEGIAQYIEQNLETFAIIYAFDSNIGSSEIMTSVIVSAEKNNLSAITVEMYLEIAANQYPDEYKILEQEILTSSRYQMGRLITQTMLTGVETTQVQYAIKKGNYFWVVTYSTSSEEFEQRFPDFEKSANSFYILQ